MKTRSLILSAVAIALSLSLGGAQRAFAGAQWECEQLTSGGGGTWACVDENGDMWYVDCSSGPCVYHKM